eukprot:6165960-Amphidinium_carterae.3
MPLVHLVHSANRSKWLPRGMLQSATHFVLTHQGSLLGCIVQGAARMFLPLPTDDELRRAKRIAGVFFVQQSHPLNMFSGHFVGCPVLLTLSFTIKHEDPSSITFQDIASTKTCLSATPELQH